MFIATKYLYLIRCTFAKLWTSMHDVLYFCYLLSMRCGNKQQYISLTFFMSLFSVCSSWEVAVWTEWRYEQSCMPIILIQYVQLKLFLLLLIVKPVRGHTIISTEDLSKAACAPFCQISRKRKVCRDISLNPTLRNSRCLLLERGDLFALK